MRYAHIVIPVPVPAPGVPDLQVMVRRHTWSLHGARFDFMLRVWGRPVIPEAFRQQPSPGGPEYTLST
jgi:hypothetical protein